MPNLHFDALLLLNVLFPDNWECIENLTEMNLWHSLCFLCSFLLWIPGSLRNFKYSAVCRTFRIELIWCILTLELSCYHCNYRQIGGKEEPNAYCLDPKKHKDHIEKVACPSDKPVCSKVRATTSKYGIVMERGCFPRFPPKCKKFGTLDNEGLSDRLFEGVDADENSGADPQNKKIVFENVVGCFCDSEDECNWEPGNEMIDMKGCKAN